MFTTEFARSSNDHLSNGTLYLLLKLNTNCEITDSNELLEVIIPMLHKFLNTSKFVFSTPITAYLPGQSAPVATQLASLASESLDTVSSIV